MLLAELAVAVLTAIASDGLLYGPFLALALVSLYWQSIIVRWDRKNVLAGSQKPKLTDITSAITGLSCREHVWGTWWFIVVLTAHWIVDSLPMLSSEGPPRFNEDDRYVLRAASQVLLLVVLLMSDMLLMLRVWRQYRGTYWPRCILVALVVLTFAVSSGALRKLIFSYRSKEDAQRVAVWFQGLMCLTLCNKTYGNVMISFRLSRVKLTSRTAGPTSDAKRRRLSRTFLYLQNGFISMTWATIAVYYGYGTGMDPVLSFPMVCNPMVAGISFVLTTLSGVFAGDMHQVMPFMDSDSPSPVNEEEAKDTQASTDVEAQAGIVE